MITYASPPAAVMPGTVMPGTVMGAPVAAPIQYAAPVAAPIQYTAPAGAVMAPRGQPNLLGAGRVVSDRPVSVQELAAEGRFFEAETVYPPGFLEKFGQPQAYNGGYGGRGSYGPPTTLVVKVKHARGLKSTDGMFAGKSDPYVVCHLVDKNGKDVTGANETSVKENTLDPVWDEDMVFEGLDNPSDYTVRMNVFDKDTFLGTGYLDWLSKDDNLGDGKIKLGQVRMKEMWQDFNLPIDAKLKSKHKGTLSVGILLTQQGYTPAAAPDPYGGSANQYGPLNLVVKVVNATKVEETDNSFFGGGKSDPYVVAHLVKGKTDAKGFEPQQTSVKDDTLNPVWDEDLVFKGLEDPGLYTLRVNMFDKDTFMGTGHLDWLSKDDDLFGDGLVPLGDIQQTETWYDAPLPCDAKMKGPHKTTLNLQIMLTAQNYEPTKASQHQVIQSDTKPDSKPSGGGGIPSSGVSRKLVVKVKHATGLRNTDGMLAGKSDPYVVLHLVDANGKDVKKHPPQQTKVIEDNLDPVWNQDITFDNLDNPMAYSLRLNIFDQDTFMGTGHLDWLSKDDQIGDAKVALSQIGSTGYGFKDMTFKVDANMKKKAPATLAIGLMKVGW
jgi:hypothetical protein